MRREISGSLLTTLYAIRAEVNKSLEWLAEETTGAKCTFLRDEPRVCVFPPKLENTISAINALEESTEGTDNGELSPANLQLGAYETARDFQTIRDTVLVATTRERHAQQRRKFDLVLGTMNSNLNQRANTIAAAQQRNNKHLEDVYREAVRKAWMQFALSVVQDQIYSCCRD